jgi:DNA ligase-1
MAMNISKLFNAFDAIEATSGKKEKLAALTALKADVQLDSLARSYFSIAMDWYRIFNVGEKSIEEDGDIDVEVFGAKPKVKTPVKPEESWQSFLKLIADIESNDPDRKPNKEAVRKFVSDLTDPQTKKWLVAALLKKPRMGVSEKTVNKVWPRLINYYEVQLADVLDDPKLLFAAGYDLAALKGAAKKKVEALPSYYYLEPKLDGIRAVCRVDLLKQKVSFFSRGGQVLNNTAPAGIDAFLMKALKGCDTKVLVFDGELFGENWNDTTRVTSKGEGEADPVIVSRLRFYVFDMLTGDEWDSQACARTYEQRREAIPFGAMPWSKDKVLMTISYRVESEADIAVKYKSCLNDNFEGSMIKHPEGLYTFSRSTAWLKYKPFITDEFEVLGTFEGKARSKHEGKLGGLILKVADGLTCQVGSGFSDEQREVFWKTPPINRIVEIEFKERTPDGMLREPVFVRVRDDKKVAE